MLVLGRIGRLSDGHACQGDNNKLVWLKDGREIQAKVRNNTA